MYQHAIKYLFNYLHRFSESGDSPVRPGRCGWSRRFRQQKRPRAIYLASLLLVTLQIHPILAQKKSPEPLKSSDANIAAILRAQQQTAAPPAKRSITISDAVSIFLQQNFQLVAARYDIDLVDAERLTARLRPNPEVSVAS